MARTQPWLIWLLIAIVATLAGFSSISLADWLHLDPCHLCVFQRFLMLILGVTAMVTAIFSAFSRTRLAALVTGISALAVALSGALAALYQSWIQAQPPGTTTCTGSQPGHIELFVEWLGQQMPSLFLATGFCEDEGYRILGLTLANWSLALFVLLAILSVWTLRGTHKPTPAA